MGLIKNLRLLFSDGLLSRMTQLENRQDLLEEHVEGRLDSMKQYAARVSKRERDAQEPAARPVRRLGAPHVSDAVQRLLERRQRRSGQLSIS